MGETQSGFNFPAEIQLADSPLVEAWLELRWKALPELERQADYYFRFYSQISDRFGHIEAQPGRAVPDEFGPFAIHYRFRSGPGEWPLFQLGPRVATVNFTPPVYSWEPFVEEANYLRSGLVTALDEEELQIETITLRYRNAIPFNWPANDLLRFLSNNLNLQIEPSQHIPGSLSRHPWPSQIDVQLTYELTQPVATGTLRIATGTRRVDEENGAKAESLPVLAFDLIVRSEDDDAPSVMRNDEFERWLRDAHAIIHEWFFSMIEGSLRAEFESQE